MTDMAHILEQLRAERAQIEEAIISLERLARSRGPRRGRPPAWLSQHPNTEAPGAKRRGRPPKQKELVASAAGNTSAVA
ncbi:MAG: hypothetical protein ACLQNE_00705 [Thermoguttaceae bacterium]|jgi:hypothetical protein